MFHTTVILNTRSFSTPWVSTTWKLKIKINIRQQSNELESGGNSNKLKTVVCDPVIVCEVSLTDHLYHHGLRPLRYTFQGFVQGLSSQKIKIFRSWKKHVYPVFPQKNKSRWFVWSTNLHYTCHCKRSCRMSNPTTTQSMGLSQGDWTPWHSLDRTVRTLVTLSVWWQWGTCLRRGSEWECNHTRGTTEKYLVWEKQSWTCVSTPRREFFSVYTLMSVKWILTSRKSMRWCFSCREMIILTMYPEVCSLSRHNRQKTRVRLVLCIREQILEEKSFLSLTVLLESQDG